MRVLLVSFAVIYATAQPAALAPPVASALEYVTDEAQVVAYVNVRVLLTSPLGDRVRQLSDGRLGVDRLVEWAGVNVARDVDEVVFVRHAAAADALTPPLLVLRGRFDSSRLEAFARDHGGQIEPYRGAQIVIGSRQASEVAIAFPSADLALVGDSMSVRRALDAKVGAVRAITDNGAFMNIVGDLDERAVWSVATFAAVTAHTALPAEVAAQLPPVDWLAVSGRFDPVAHGDVRAEARDLMAAQGLREVVGGFLALARLQTARNRETRAALDSMILGGEGTMVSISFDLTPGLLTLIDSKGIWRLALPWIP